MTTLKQVAGSQDWELSEEQSSEIKKVMAWFNECKQYPLSSKDIAALKECFLDQDLLKELTEEEVKHLVEQGIEPASFPCEVWEGYFKKTPAERLTMKSQSRLGDLTLGDYTKFMIECFQSPVLKEV